MQKAIFLDRDGVLNKEIGKYIEKFLEFEVLTQNIPFLKKAVDQGYLLFVITNQGGIAKGLYTRQDLNMMHEHLKNTLAGYGISLKEIFYCPHHPDFSNCLCRKPDSLMIEKAISKYNLDPSQSLMIGDKIRDIEASEKVGVKGYLIKENQVLSEELIPIK